jgi:hypothetical protein
MFTHSSIRPFGVLSARHLHVPPFSVRVGEEILLADLFSSVLLANRKLEHEGLAAHVVPTAGEEQRCSHATTLDELEFGL